MRIIYTEHALVRMKQRGISKTEIKEALKYSYAETIQENGTLSIRYKNIRGILEIIHKKSHTVCIIITCYFL